MSFRTKTFVQKVIGDIGNSPLLTANVCAVLICVAFGTRKALLHPDVTLVPNQRDAVGVTQKSLDEARMFRESTGFFARLFHPISEALSGVTGRTVVDVRDYGRPQPISLEHTNYFNDGLYDDVEAVAPPTGIYLNEPETEETMKRFETEE